MKLYSGDSYARTHLTLVPVERNTVPFGLVLSRSGA